MKCHISSTVPAPLAEAIAAHASTLGFDLRATPRQADVVILGEQNSTASEARVDGELLSMGRHLPGFKERAAKMFLLPARDLATFVAVVCSTAPHSAIRAQSLYGNGVNMYTSDQGALIEALRLISQQERAAADGFPCPFCDIHFANVQHLVAHAELYHVQAPNCLEGICPVCPRPTRVHHLVPHLREGHNPRHDDSAQLGLPHVNIRGVALIVCRHPDGRFLMTHEFGSVGFWLPGGRVDRGESFCDAAVREAREETGVDVRLTGVLCVSDLSLSPFALKEGHHDDGDDPMTGQVAASGAGRVTFLAEPVYPERPPKSLPDFESSGASWVRHDELTRLRCRSRSDLRWFQYVHDGGRALPLDILRL